MATKRQLKDALISAAQDAHGLAAIYMRGKEPTGYGVIPGAVGKVRHSLEFLDCRVPICEERRKIAYGK